jgi:hypothetical protein
MRRAVLVVVSGLLASVWLAPAAGAQNAAPCYACTTQAPAPDAVVEEGRCWYEGGTWSTEFLSGYFPMANVGPKGSTFSIIQHRNQRVDYAPQSLRVGYEYCREFFPDTCLAGSMQSLIEWNAAPILKDFGNYFTGPCYIGRYNLHQPGSCLTPYIQIGAGLEFNDAFKDQDQRLIGRFQEFLLRSEVGLKVDICAGWAFTAEAGFQHISNARLAPRNGGINNIGGAIGFTYTFGK